jgi:hypothetical protein
LTPYLDASAIVSLIVNDVHTARARALAAMSERFLISDLTAAEVSSAIAIRWRSKTLSQAEANGALLLFDAWRPRNTESVDILSTDIREADQLIRGLNCALRAPDAIHVAAARRLGAPLVTFDLTMAREARALGLEVIET